MEKSLQCTVLTVGIWGLDWLGWEGGVGGGGLTVNGGVSFPRPTLPFSKNETNGNMHI